MCFEIGRGRTFQELFLEYLKNTAQEGICCVTAGYLNTAKELVLQTENYKIVNAHKVIDDDFTS